MSETKDSYILVPKYQKFVRRLKSNRSSSQENIWRAGTNAMLSDKYIRRCTLFKEPPKVSTRRRRRCVGG